MTDAEIYKIVYAINHDKEVIYLGENFYYPDNLVHYIDCESMMPVIDDEPTQNLCAKLRHRTTYVDLTGTELSDFRILEKL